MDHKASYVLMQTIVVEVRYNLKKHLLVVVNKECSVKQLPKWSGKHKLHGNLWPIISFIFMNHSQRIHFQQLGMNPTGILILVRVKYATLIGKPQGVSSEKEYTSQ